jgi:hypothetical protein
MTMTADAASYDPVPPSAYPSLQKVTGPPPPMPSAWSGVALLHPFSPPLSTDPRPDSPFFQLCVANVQYRAGSYLSIQVTGTEYGTWWYFITSTQTELSTDQGRTWTRVDMGWTLPGDWFGAQRGNASCAGRSPLNWMASAPTDWWKVPVPIPNSPPGATWMWFDSSSRAPVRMMFGQGPPTPVKGDPGRLAFFQMFSFTYMPVFGQGGVPEERGEWADAAFPGFQVGNPNNFQDFVWNPNFGMTAFMTPVNERFDPLPTRVLYVWKPDGQYRAYSDRAQHTLMRYDYNLGTGTLKQVALLTGHAPQPPGPPESDEGFLITYYSTPQLAPTCIGGPKFPFPQEPPNWVSIPAVEGTIRATITNNPVVSPRQSVAIYSVLFPPSPPNYPEATYLWTWYAPQEPTGVHSRPVTFMQSQSGVGVGTSLALADYYYYEELAQPIDPENFAIPLACGRQTRKLGLRARLP